MVLIKSGSLSQADVLRLAKKRRIALKQQYGSVYTKKDWGILTEVLQKTTSLEKLKLNETILGDALQNSNFTAALAKNRTIKTLNLHWALSGDEGARVLAIVLKENSMINNINLESNDIGDLGAAALAEAMKENTALEALSLIGNQIGDAAASELAAALAENKTLQSLNLSCNHISAAGSSALADALKDNNSLRKINLEYNNIGDEGAKLLAEALKVNSSVQVLYLGDNDISDSGAAALADALAENKTLQALDMRDNQIGDEGAKALSEALRVNASLRTLHLECNKIGEKMGEDFLNSLKENDSSSIESINLVGNQVTSETQEKIEEEIDRIQNSIRTADVDGAIIANETRQGTEEQELQSAITQLREELVEKNELIAEKDKDLASTKAILRKIGMMANSNGKDENSNHEDGVAPHSRCRGTESGDRTQREKELQSEIDLLRKQLKNANSIETIDLTNDEVELSTATEDEEEPPIKRRRTISSLAVSLAHSHQILMVKEEVTQRCTQAARQEKESLVASLRDVQEDLEIQQETTELVNLTLDTWQGRFDRVYELAAAAGVDAAVLKSIREGNSN